MSPAVEVNRNLRPFRWKTFTASRTRSRIFMTVRPLLSLMAWQINDESSDSGLTEAAVGALRVFSDVVLHQNGAGEWGGISPHRAVAGGTLVQPA